MAECSLLPPPALPPLALPQALAAHRVAPPRPALPLRPALALRPALRLQPPEMLSHIPALRAFALQLCRSPDQADDLVQDALCRALGHLDSFAPGTRLRSWLFTILRNAFYTGLRKRRREVPDPEGLMAARLSVAPAHDGALAVSQFLRAFAGLSAEHRQVLTLVGALGLTYDEAAQVTALKAGTVKSRVSRARAALGENPWPRTDGATLHVLDQARATPLAS